MLADINVSTKTFENWLISFCVVQIIVGIYLFYRDGIHQIITVGLAVGIALLCLFFIRKTKPSFENGWTKKVISLAVYIWTLWELTLLIHYKSLS